MNLTKKKGQKSKLTNNKSFGQISAYGQSRASVKLYAVPFIKLIILSKNAKPY
jgi:hypothetical protein